MTNSSSPVPPTLTMSVREAAIKLGIGRNLAYRLVNAGQIPAVRFGRLLRVPRVALEQQLAQLATCLSEKTRAPSDMGQGRSEVRHG